MDIQTALLLVTIAVLMVGIGLLFYVLYVLAALVRAVQQLHDYMMSEVALGEDLEDSDEEEDDGN